MCVGACTGSLKVVLVHVCMRLVVFPWLTCCLAAAPGRVGLSNQTWIAPLDAQHFIAAAPLGGGSSDSSLFLRALFFFFFSMLDWLPGDLSSSTRSTICFRAWTLFVLYCSVFQPILSLGTIFNFLDWKNLITHHQPEILQNDRLKNTAPLHVLSTQTFFP